jgi:hypothetical protein
VVLQPPSRQADRASLAVLLQRSGNADPAESVGPLRRTCRGSQQLETTYDLPLVEPEYRLEAVAAQPVVVEALGVDSGSPFFLIERTSSGTGNRPVDYEQAYYRGDMVRFVTRLARRRKEGM